MTLIAIARWLLTGQVMSIFVYGEQMMHCEFMSCRKI